MARNRQHEVREASDEGVKAAEEMGANILALSARAAEQSVNGFSRMLGGQNTHNVMQQSQRGMEVMQAWTRLLGIGYQDMSKEYMNWARNQMQTSVSSLARFMQCRTPDQLLACYNQLLGENIALALTLNGRLAEISKEVVDRTAERITEVAEQTQAEKQAA
jgi:Phasin protein